jgi:enoyl-CoA hydratase/carnithine racemase
VGSSDNMKYDDILYSKEDGVGYLTLNRPEVMNACTLNTYREMQRALETADADDEVKVVVITGAGRGFCSGDDVRGLFLSEEARQEILAPQLKRWIKHTPEALDALIEYPKPTIAAVNGAAVGYGCDIALMCDIRIASDRARFGELFIKRALTPASGGLLILPRLVGLGKAYELILTGDIIDATEAERIGMVNRVVPHDKLGEETRVLATKLAHGPPIAQKLAKEALRVGMNWNLREFWDFHFAAERLAFASEDHLEGAKSFLEKREPQFKGR